MLLILAMGHDHHSWRSLFPLSSDFPCKVKFYFLHYDCHVVLFSLDLKVDVHRKNSSESSEEVATLRPVVEKVSVHRAEQCTQADHEHYRTKLQGNPSFPMLLYYTHEERIIHKSFKSSPSTRVSNLFHQRAKTVIVGWLPGSFIHSFIQLACAECDNSLPFSGASSIPLCYVLFPASIPHQLFFHPPSLHLAIYFLVCLSILLFPNSYIVLFWGFCFLPFLVHDQTYLTLSLL